MNHLPLWLRNVPLPPRPTTADPAVASAPADDVPDWLRTSEENPAPIEAPDAGSSETPDWLRDLEQEVADTPPPSSESRLRAAGLGATDWLRSIGADDAAEAQPETPEPPQMPPPTTTSRIRMPVGATDWLRSIGQETDLEEELGLSEQDQSAQSESEPEVPDWLRDVNPDEVMSTDEVEAAVARHDPDVPDWLSEDTAATVEDSTVAADAPVLNFDETVAAGDDVPDWLREVVPPEDMPIVEPRREAAAPDWLRDADDTDLNLSAGTDVPDWLSQIGAESGEDERFASPAAGPEEEVPDWLRGAEAAPATSDEEAPDWLRGADVAPATSDEEAPDWLRGADVAPAAPSEDVPAWLRDAEVPPAAPAPAAAPSEDVPAWLRDAEVPPATPAAPSEDVPAWLRDAEVPPAAPAPAAAPSEDVPAWLRDAEVPPAAPAAPSEDVPAWLRDAEVPPATPAAPAAPSEDVPAWLRDAEVPPAAPAAPAAPSEDVPAWLRDAEVPPAAPAPAAAPSEDVPAWLRDAEPSEPSAAPTPAVDMSSFFADDAPAATPAAGAQPPASGELPNWLVDDDENAAALPTRASGDPALPSWLRGVADEPPPAAPPPRTQRPSDEQARRNVMPADDEGNDFLGGADLPSWLRPSEPERPADPAATETLGWLSRLGAADQDESDDMVPAVAAATAPPRPIYARSAGQMEAIALLGRLVRAPYPEPAPLAAPVPLTRWQRIGLDRVLYALLALVALIGALLPGLIAPLGAPTPNLPAALAFEEVIAGLDSESVVLVAYEWGAQRSTELRSIEQPVIDRLTAQRAKMIVVSTDLQGALLSFDLREPLRAAGYNVEPDGRVFGGRDYILLGYRPGGEIALRQIARDLRGELTSDFIGQDASTGLVANNDDGSPRVSSVRDLDLMIVIADQAQDVQGWMEQVHRAAPDVPVAFLLPEEVRPLVQPYLVLPNIYHLAGSNDALAFAADSDESGTIAQTAGRQSLLVIAFIILLLAGVIGSLGMRRSVSEVPGEW